MKGVWCSEYGVSVINTHGMVAIVMPVAEAAKLVRLTGRQTTSCALRIEGLYAALVGAECEIDGSNAFTLIASEENIKFRRVE